jgi:uncharacterized LabA/DUF88 family protein
MHCLLQLSGSFECFADWVRYQPVQAIEVGGGLIMLVAFAALWIGYHRLRQRSEALLAAPAALHRAIVASRAARARAGTLRPGNARIEAPLAAGGAHDPKQFCHVKIYIDHSTLRADWPKAAHGSAAIDWDGLPAKVLAALASMTGFADKVFVYCGANVYGSYYNEDYYDLLNRLHDKSHAPVLPFRENRKRSIQERLMAELPKGADGDAVTARANEEIAAELSEWRKENELQRTMLLQGVNRKFGYVVFPIERRTPGSLRTADYTADGIPLAPEKRVDTQLCADLIADGAFNIYDVAVLVANDADFIPAVEIVENELGKPVVHVGLPQFSRAIRGHSSQALDLNSLVA